MKLESFFPFFAFLSQKYAQVLKYFAQLCDFSIAAFGNSEVVAVFIVIHPQCHCIVTIGFLPFPRERLNDFDIPKGFQAVAQNDTHTDRWTSQILDSTSQVDC